eukprot:3159916-Pleurochrysis_carterae.AAC.3
MVDKVGIQAVYVGRQCTERRFCMKGVIYNLCESSGASAFSGVLWALEYPVLNLCLIFWHLSQCGSARSQRQASRSS